MLMRPKQRHGIRQNKTNVGQNSGTRGLSIKTRLIIICILFGITPLLIVNTISSSISRTTLRDTSKQLTADMVTQTRSSINYFIEDIEKNITKFIVNDLNSTDSNILTIYEAGKNNKTEKIKAVQKIVNRLIYASSMEKSIGDVALISNDGTVMGEIPLVREELLAGYKDFEMKEDAIWQKGIGEKTSEIYFIRKVKNTMIGEDFGKLVCHVKIDSIISSMSEIKLLKGADVYIIDREGNMIYNKDSQKTEAEKEVLSLVSSKEEAGSDMKKGKLIAYSTAKNGWRIVAEIPEKSLTSQLDEVSLLIWFAVIAAGIVAGIVGFLVSKNFSMPIIKIMQLMKKAECGDLTVQAEGSRKDEIGMLYHSFNNMITNIRRLLEEAKTVVADTLGDGVTLKRSTQQSVEAFEQLALSIEDITEGSSSQADDAGQSSEAMMRLAESIQKVRGTTKEILEENKDAKEIIKEAADSVELLNTTMDSSIRISEKIKSSIMELNLLTRSIWDIMKLVDDISEQTNLLALNASIEAARAGDVGRGFAVVAHEVKNLAEQSKTSTGKVRKTLGTIELKTKDAVNLVKEANNIFTNQEQAVKKTYLAFNHIIGKLKGMDVELETVNHQVIDMEMLKEEMTGKINRIKLVTEDNASATQEVNALSEQQKAVIEQLFALSNKLTTTMDKLNLSIEAFRVE